MKPIHSTGSGYPFSRRVGRIFLIFFLVSTAVQLNFTQPLRAQFEEVTARSYAVKFRPIEEILPLAKALLSRKGLITENRAMQVMVVSDYPTNLDRIDSLLTRFDIPLHQVRITVHLVLGSQVTEEEEMMRSPDIQAVLGNRYNFNRLEPFEKSVIITEEHKQIVLELANGQFIVGFTQVYLPLAEPQVELRDFILISVRKSLGGEERKQLLGTSVAMKDGEEHVVGAMKYGLKDETLLIIVRTDILE